MMKMSTILYLIMTKIYDFSNSHIFLAMFLHLYLLEGSLEFPQKFPNVPFQNFPMHSLTHIYPKHLQSQLNSNKMVPRSIYI